jgi:hypothetical protein
LNEADHKAKAHQAVGRSEGSGRYYTRTWQYLSARKLYCRKK